MSESNFETYLGSSLDCPSSPFDHQASFVHFPSVPSKEAISAAVPDIVITQPKQESNRGSKDGIKDLAKSMGYRANSMSTREEELIHADALTCIEKLRQDCPLTRRPRDLHPIMVRALLQLIIPEKYVRAHQRFGIPYQDGIWTCEIDDLSSAAAVYIRFLKRTKRIEQEKSLELEQEKKTGSEMKIEQATKYEETLVEKVLRKIESWCDDWLNGKIAEEDWNKMDSCL